MTSPKLGRALLALSLIVAFPGSALAQDALPWFHTYTVPGDYVVGATDSLPLSTGGGLRTRRLHMSGVPANAEILGAFLYWETMWSGPQSVLDDLRGQVKFRGEDVTAVTSSSLPLSGSFAGCRGTSNGQTITMMRADVLRLLPLQLDENGKPTGRRLVNDLDLTANSLDLHSVTMPDSGIVNVVPQTAGASLLVIYQNQNPAAPLKSVVVYDGLHIQGPGETTSLTIRGFVDAVAGSAANLTYIGGSRSKNYTDRVLFGGTDASLTQVSAFDPFSAGGLFGDDRAWSNPTFTIKSGAWTPADDPNYGEQVRTKIDHTKSFDPYDCLSTDAVIFSATTQDSEGDGLPDKLEERALMDPAGLPYPDISGPADPGVKDLFIEVGAMFAPAGTTYRVATAPFVGTIEDEDGHNHMPTPPVLKAVGDALANPPIGQAPIAVHFDVGPVAAYRALGPDYASPEADQYILGILYPALARGGEQVEEKESARFPGFSGVVSWPAGVQVLAQAPVSEQGEELADPDGAGWCPVPTSDVNCRRRFDLNRQGIFHYLWYAHARGVPKSTFPCLGPEILGVRTPVAFANPVTMTCPAGAISNVEYDIPKSVSGVAELPGRYAMVSLGLWDNFVGSVPLQGNTTLHEIGHNLDLWHGGGKPQLTNLLNGRVRVFVQPNCRPNYLSIMSYLFQATGVRNALGEARARLSAEVNGPFDEQALVQAPLGLSPDAPYTSWYAPKQPGTLGYSLNLTPAGKHCDGSPLGPDDPAVGAVRLDTSSPDASIDWAAASTDLTPAETAALGLDALGQYVDGQDVNFDGIKTGQASVQAGFNDWTGIALNQLGSGHSMAGFSIGLGLDWGGLDWGGLDWGGLDWGGLDWGGLDWGGLDWGGLDWGGLDWGGLDWGGLDWGGVDSEIEAELTYETVLESIAPGGSTPPNALKAFVRGTDGAAGINSSVPVGTWVPVGEATTCTAALAPADCHRIRLDWEPPTVGTPDGYAAARVWDPTGVAVAPTPESLVDRFTPTTDAATAVIDGEELPNAQRFIYFVQGSVAGELGSLSNFAILPAKNDPPVAVGNIASTDEDVYVDIDVLADDTDIDTELNSDLRVASISNVHGGTAVLRPDGRTVRFTPSLNANSVNTPGGFYFSYTADDGKWIRHSAVAMSNPSNDAMVSITVNPVNDTPTANAQLVNTLEDTATIITLSASDVETCNLTFSIVTGPSHGSLSGLTNNDCVPGMLAGPFNTDSLGLTYTPGLNYNGADSFTYKVHDTGDGASAALDSTVVTVSITVIPVNDKPTAAAAAVGTNANTAKAIALRGGDVETCNLTFSIVSGPSHGTLSVITNSACVAGTLVGPFNTDSASVTYTPSAGYVGADSFRYKVHDTGDGSSPALDSLDATVSITVTGTSAIKLYGLVNVNNLPPAAGVKFTPSPTGTLVDFDWIFTSGGVAVDSRASLPSVSIQLGTSGTPTTYGPSNCSPLPASAACLGFTYNVTSMQWSLDWKPAYAAVGTYYVIVRSAATGQRFPAAGDKLYPNGFPVVFKNP